jgi:tetratricopeptide (TPR) repeat protein
MPRSVRLILFAVLGLFLLGAIAVGVDWWFAAPQGVTARYVGRGKCAECHQAETALWSGSDHDLAMGEATPATVLGNFDDQEFHHVAFEDLGGLSQDDLRTLLEGIDARQLALAMHGADAELEAGIFAAVGHEAADRVRREREQLPAVRPCDVSWAQGEIGERARRLEREGRIVVNFGVRSRMFRQDDEFRVTTDNRQGDMQTFRVKYVFGVRPLQQYLVEFPDGRVQCLPITWDTERNRWYHLYPGEPIPHDDPLHWTRPLQNWNYMCAECHTTNLNKNFNLSANAYDTTWSEIDVSCETCHGPGSLHVELAESRGPFWDRRYGFGLPNLKSEDSRVEIETCAPCHSRRRIVHPHAAAGEPFLDYFVPEMLDGELYYADGQVLDEDYVYGSFIQSLMYQKGVRCSDCHDPHSVRVKFNDNRLCGQCHVPSKYDTEQHHYHPDASKPGTLCVECHMAETTYMGADLRRDHSLRVPRPDLTVSLGIPNACSGCHDDAAAGETARWAADKCFEWYGEPAGMRRFAEAIDAGRKGLAKGERDLEAVTRRKDTSAMVRATAIALLGRYNTAQGYPSGRAQAAAITGLEDPDGLVRVAAVRSLQNLPPDQLQRRLAPMLHDPLRAVRSEAARSLARVPRAAFNERDGAAFDAALAEYVQGQEAVSDQAAAHLNMAVVHIDLGRQDKALAEYQAALKIDPEFVPARINLAMLYDTLGDKAAAEEQFRQVLKLEPGLGEAHYSLGLLLAEDPARMPEAVGCLARAAELSPENRRIRYNYGLALQKLGRVGEAEKALTAGLKLSAGQADAADFLHALAILYAQTGQWDQAIARARELAELQPDNPQWRQLLDYLQSESQRPADGGATKPTP